MSAYVFARTGYIEIILNHCIIQEQRYQDITLSLYFQNIKMSWIAYGSALLRGILYLRYGILLMSRI